ncbi:MAG: DNA recombination protein RmuC [Ilumatobacteraceae bacterium]|jgi:DNA recombination protein RmuC|nr:DNA recombination protein RmuC [Ilumatobacteraceae bacterium]
MESLVIGLFVVLIAVMGGGIVFLQRNMKQTSAPVSPSVVAAPVDIAPIVEAVKAALDVNAISTGVQGAVESKIREVAADVLTKANESAGQQADERLNAQRDALEAQTKNLLQPFEQKIATLGKEVEKLHTHNTEKFGNVDEAVKGLATQTQALRNVLSSAQGRGNWGERMLEDILSHAGFERGINYEKQEILGDGGKPDYSFYLPPDRVLYLDSKFPVDNYLKYFEASDENSRNMYRDQFLKNVEDRVKELERRDYVSQSNRNALDYVLLFIPNESVIGFIQQHKPTLIDSALSKKVVLCSPLTLYAFLGVVRQATDSFHMEQNAKEILGLLTGFSKAWTQYVKYLTEISKHFDNIQKKLKAVTTGRVMSNLRKPIREIDELTKAQGVLASDETLLSVQEAFKEIEQAESELDDSAED